MDEQLNRLIDKAWSQCSSRPFPFKKTFPSRFQVFQVEELQARYAPSLTANTDLTQPLRPSQRLLIAVGGIPGSGKTTLASLLVSRLNERYAQDHPGLTAGTGSLDPLAANPSLAKPDETTPTKSTASLLKTTTSSTAHPLAVLVPMDGYHLTRAQLSALPDPTTAHARRGAAFTFDAEGYLELVKRLRQPITPEMGSIFAPTFDHKVKDPVAGGVEIGRGVKVVVFEGNYVALEDTTEAQRDADQQGGDEAENSKEGEEEEEGASAWSRAKKLMDKVWFVDVSEERARARLVKRHVAAGIEQDEDAAGKRADANDLVNGREIVARRGRVDEVVRSVEDRSWSPDGT
ncbi:MAG: hypothetical protein Q9162_001674 [Coniocarpon cinnabarinum]